MWRVYKLGVEHNGLKRHPRSHKRQQHDANHLNNLKNFIYDREWQAYTSAWAIHLVELNFNQEKYFLTKRFLSKQ